MNKTDPKTTPSGALIRSMRSMRGKSQLDIAHALGLTRTSIVNMESGMQSVKLEHLLNIAEFLGLELKLNIKSKKQEDGILITSLIEFNHE